VTSLADRLRSTKPAFGFWSSTGHHAIVDAAASVRPDFVCIDTQHGVALGNLDPSVFTSLAHYGVPSLVRVESADPTPIGRALDLGATGIIVPLVDSVDQARRAVSATKHAPNGIRSYGMQTRRVGPFEERPFVAIQIETTGALEEIDGIVAIGGVDAVYIGPADLGLAVGGNAVPDVNQVWDGTAPNSSEMGVAFKVVLEAARSRDIMPGLHCGDGATANRAVREGFAFAAVAADIPLMMSGLTRELAAARHR
jgi:4-hydroxy-2-oxoheptanedioate aldolase